MNNELDQEDLEDQENLEDQQDLEDQEDLLKGDGGYREKDEFEATVLDTGDYTGYFENLQSIGFTIIIILTAGFLALCFAIGLKHER